MHIMHMFAYIFSCRLHSGAMFSAKELRPYFSSVPALKFSTMTSLDFSSRFTISWRWEKLEVSGAFARRHWKTLGKSWAKS